MPRHVTPATSVENLRKEAKRWLKELRAGNGDARARLERAYPSAPAAATLRDVQHALAQEYGHESWIALNRALEERSSARTAPITLAANAEEYEGLARDLVQAFDARDEAALHRVNERYHRTFTFDDLWAEIWRRVYSFRQRAFKESPQVLHLAEAQTLIAQDAGFSNWAALTRSAGGGATPVPAYEIDAIENRVAPRRQLADREWDNLIAVMKEHRIAGLAAEGMVTDAVLGRIADLDHVTALALGGCRQLTDDGLLQLARMPQLRYLNLSEYPGGKLTDRGLAVLRHLPNLRIFEMSWQSGITDAGVANLRYCDQLERVDLMGSPTGDGAIEALQGKPRLCHFHTGRQVTDAGLALLRHFPMLKEWRGDDGATGIGPDTRQGRLQIDGLFTDAGLASLAGLEGIVDLDLFWHVTGITSDGFAHLAKLPNLQSLAADRTLSDNAAMAHIAALPRLRRLRVQETVATDEGFEALGRSKTIEEIWGRRCAGLGNRGFVALSKMPALRGLAVSCQNVDDETLSRLPEFPSLRELVPIFVKDDGFRHIGRCVKLDRLMCMYCRETTDRATEHIGSLQLRSYYAGLTLITDRSLEILGRMSSLERIEFYECNGITDAGLTYLTGLPRLREVELAGLPGVSLQGTYVFPKHIRVRYST